MGVINFKEMDLSVRTNGAFSACNGLRVLGQTLSPLYLDYLESVAGLSPHWIMKTAEDDIEPPPQVTQKIEIALFWNEGEFERICYDVAILKVYLHSIAVNKEITEEIIRWILNQKVSVLRILAILQTEFETSLAIGNIRHRYEECFWTHTDLIRQQ